MRARAPLIPNKLLISDSQLSCARSVVPTRASALGSREIVGVLSLEILRLIGEIRNPNPSWDLVTRNLTANW